MGSRANKGAIGSSGSKDNESMTNRHLMPVRSMSDGEVGRYADRSLGRSNTKKPLRTVDEEGSAYVDKRSDDKSGRRDTPKAKKSPNPNVPAPRSGVKMEQGLERPGLKVPVTNQFSRIGTSRNPDDDLGFMHEPGGTLFQTPDGGIPAIDDYASPNPNAMIMQLLQQLGLLR